MNLIAQKNVTGFYVQNGTNDVYNTAGTFIDAIAASTTAVVNKDGKTVTWNNTNKKWENSGTFYNEVAIVITNAAGTIYQSDWVLWDKTFARKYNDYSAAVEKVDYIGYNGTSGSIDVVPAAGNYKIGIKLIEESAAVQQAPLFKFVQYQATSTDGQLEVAAGLIKNAIANYKKEPEQRILFERVSNGTFGTSVAAVTFTKGSNIISGTGIGTAIAAVGVNTPVKVNATTTTTPVYLATYLTADTATLDVAFQGTTGSYAAKVQTVAPTAWGIRMTGVPLDFREGVKGYFKSNWQVTLYEEWGDTILTNSSIASKGVGTYEEVAETEWFLEGNDTRAMRVIAPQYISRKDAVLGNTYDIVSFSWNDANTTTGVTGVIGQSQVSWKQFMFAVKSNATDTIYKQAFNV